jgi:hypothetical protein
MTFAIANFASVGNASKPLTGVGTTTLKGAPSVFSYATADAVNTVTAANYFAGAIRHLNRGDLIYALCVAGSGGTPVAKLLYVVSIDKAAGTIDVSDGNTISATDTY